MEFSAGLPGNRPKLGTQHKVQPCCIRESSKIAISREKSCASVNATLGDERVTQTCLTMFGKHFRSQYTSSFPITRLYLEQRHVRKHLRNFFGERGIAQQFRQHCRYHEHLPIRKRLVEPVSVMSPATFQKCDPRAGVRRNHRSAFKSAVVCEKRTLPRRARSCE
jgi:hypothetical protein